MANKDLTIEERKFEEVRQLHADYSSLFNSKVGEKILERLKRKFYFYRTTACQGGERLDTDKTLFREGQRSVILHILEFKDIDLDKIYKNLNRQQEGA